MHPRFHAATHPEKPAAIAAETGETLSYGTLERVANQGAHLFRSLGIQNGDTIAVWLPNTLRYFEIYWAAQRAGLYITPISTRLRADEAAYILRDCSARLLVTSGDIDAVPQFLAQRDTLPLLATLLSADVEVTGAARWEDAIAALPEMPIDDEEAGFHMVYSSGTTGRPKGVRVPLTRGPATASHPLADRQQRRYAIGPDTVFLSPAPIYHTAPLVFTTAVQRLGGTVVLLDHFTPDGALAAIERYRVTHTQMVPTMFLRMLRLPAAQRRGYDVSSLAYVVHAAAPCPIDVKREMIDWMGPIIYEYYGGSEGNGSTAITTEEWLRKPGSVGRPDSGTIHVCDENGHELPPGEQGTIYFAGGWDFEYLNDAAKTRDARNPLRPDWSTLGDIGYLDADGYLFLTDRKSFMIISGGVNIYPQEAENLLATHPEVADVAVIGVPSAEMGEEVKAVVQPRYPASVGPELAERLIAYCRERLSTIKCPRSIDFAEALPRHETGKLYKREIRDRYWQGHDKRVS